MKVSTFETIIVQILTEYKYLLAENKYLHHTG